MPFCELKTSAKLDRETKAEISHALARAIELIPGKSERWVMTLLEDENYMMFSGTDENPCAMLTVKTFGELSKEQYDLLSSHFCDILHTMAGIPQERIYVVYTPVNHWGWNRENF